MITVSAINLTKDYHAFRAVDNIDFEISSAECFGFLGPNGAGKTTVMRMIYCFLPVTSGSLHVLGLDVAEHPSEIKSRIGVMPQDNNP